MIIKLLKDFRHYKTGKELQVTNNLGRELISEGAAIELKAIPTKGVTKKGKTDWTLKN